MNELEIMGHKAKVENIWGRVANGLLQKKDELAVWLTFEPDSVEGLLSFGITIPLKEYSPDELHKVIQEEAERVISKHIVDKAVMKAKLAIQQARKKELDELGCRLLTSLVGGA